MKHGYVVTLGFEGPPLFICEDESEAQQTAIDQARYHQGTPVSYRMVPYAPRTRSRGGVTPGREDQSAPTKE